MTPPVLRCVLPGKSKLRNRFLTIDTNVSRSPLRYSDPAKTPRPSTLVAYSRDKMSQKNSISQREIKTNDP
ncbi:hypothetical protein VTH06DRAFT_6090 [Thermothelomyces fergusii]